MNMVRSDDDWGPLGHSDDDVMLCRTNWPRSLWWGRLRKPVSKCGHLCWNPKDDTGPKCQKAGWAAHKASKQNSQCKDVKRSVLRNRIDMAVVQSEVWDELQFLQRANKSHSVFLRRCVALAESQSMHILVSFSIYASTMCIQRLYFRQHHAAWLKFLLALTNWLSLY